MQQDQVRQTSGQTQRGNGSKTGSRIKVNENKDICSSGISERHQAREMGIEMEKEKDSRLQ